MNKYVNAEKYSAAAILVSAAIGLVANESHMLGKMFSTPDQPQSVVRVHCEHPNGNGEHGSGVLIRSDLVLTAQHVVRDRGNTGEVTVEFKSGLKRVAEVIKEDKTLDVALLQFDSVFYIPARPADKAAVKQQPVTICGFPKNAEYAEKAGRVVGFRSPTKTSEPTLFVVSNRCESGMSGGPVFDAEGRVVGTLFGTLRFANCTGLDAIKEFIHAQPIPRQDRREDDSEVACEIDGDCSH